MNKVLKYSLLAGAFLVFILIAGGSYFLLDRGFFSNKEERYFRSKLEEFKSSNKKSVDLVKLTNFEWDKVCLFGGVSINLKDKNVVKALGFKPKLFLKSKYYVDSDSIGALFVDKTNRSVRIFQYFLNDDEIKNLYDKVKYSPDLIEITYRSGGNIACHDKNRLKFIK